MGFCEVKFASRIARCDFFSWAVRSRLISEVPLALPATRQYFLIVDWKLYVSGNSVEDSKYGQRYEINHSRTLYNCE